MREVLPVKVFSLPTQASGKGACLDSIGGGGSLPEKVSAHTPHDTKKKIK